MNAIASVYATFRDLDEAERIGRVLVEERLAACVNISVPAVRSTGWQGAIEQAAEVAAIFKTTSKSAPCLVLTLWRAHSYDVPAP
jgi:periplasmic divalent cation tolerance protein